MLEINACYPDEEDITVEFSRIISSIRDNVTDLEFLFKKIFDGQTFIGEDEVIQLLHLKKKADIPERLPKYRPSRLTGYLYKVSEVYSFIESKKIGG